MAEFQGGYKDRFNLIALVIRYKNIRFSDIQVLVSICKHYNMKSETCWPSITTLSSDTKLSRRQVLRAITRLEVAKIILIDRTKGKSSFYCPDWELVA